MFSQRELQATQKRKVRVEDNKELCDFVFDETSLAAFERRNRREIDPSLCIVVRYEGSESGCLDVCPLTENCFRRLALPLVADGLTRK